MGRFAINSRWASLTPYDLVRVALAAILLVAAGLKCHQLATSPMLGDGLLDSRWLLMATVEFELFFGLWLLANLLPKWTHRAAVLCFGLFAAVSLYKALAGHASCGCFGRVEVNPWYTFTLDAAAVLALLRWRPSGTASSLLLLSRAFALRATAVMLVWLSVGLPVAVAMGTYQPTLLAEDGIILGDDDLVILEPEKWIGKRFPLLDYIDIGDQLKEGKWLVLLYHYDCPRCAEVIPRYEELARRSGGNPSLPRIAVIQVLSPGERRTMRTSSSTTNCAWGVLDNKKEKEWFVETPAILCLANGVVGEPVEDYSSPDIKPRMQKGREADEC